VTVRTAFTCSNPLVEDVVKELAASGVARFLTFPLYPQYSYTTTKGSHDRVRAAVKRFAPQAKLFEMGSFPTHPLFLKAHAEQIRALSSQFSRPFDEEIHLLFSAHSIPEKLVTEEGDPYKKEMEDTVNGVVTAAGWKGPWSLAWQSKLGPVKWLEPFTDKVIEDLGAKGVKQVLVVPIAFVTDHIETLCEIDIEFAEEAAYAGIKEFKRTPGLNDHPTFIKGLVELAQSRTDFWS
jgi:ferrochelatase